MLMPTGHHNDQSTMQQRLHALLDTTLQRLGAVLQQADLTDVMCTDDGQVFAKGVGIPSYNTGIRLSLAERLQLIRLLAARDHQVCNVQRPRLHTTLPSGARVHALIPPITPAPILAIRKHASRVFTLHDYVAAQVMTAEQAAVLTDAVCQRRNIIVAGTAGSGKTTLLNALLHEVRDSSAWVVIIEDTPEILCNIATVRVLRTVEGLADMQSLLQDTMRLCLDRLVVGEVREGRATVHMLNAWLTHGGGLATLHARDGQAALLRLEMLALEVLVSVPPQLISTAVDVIVTITQDPTHGVGRRVSHIEEVRYVRNKLQVRSML